MEIIRKFAFKLHSFVSAEATEQIDNCACEYSTEMYILLKV